MQLLAALLASRFVFAALSRGGSNITAENHGDQRPRGQLQTRTLTWLAQECQVLRFPMAMFSLPRFIHFRHCKALSNFRAFCGAQICIP